MKKSLLVLSLLLLSVPTYATTYQEGSASAMETVSDTGITTKVKAAFINEKLFGEKEISATGIKVVTNNGVVELSGTTDSQEKADNAVKIAKTISGVKDVKSSIVVKK